VIVRIITYEKENPYAGEDEFSADFSIVLVCFSVVRSFHSRSPLLNICDKGHGKNSKVAVRSDRIRVAN
jgi:hypothetical protein